MKGVHSRNAATDEKYDEIDKPQESKHVTFLDLGVLLYSIIFHFVDVGYDIHVALEYYETKRYPYFFCTVAFTLVPSIIIALISIRMYWDDYKENSNFWFASTRISLCALGVILQSAPLIRYCDSLWYAIKSLRAKYKSDTQQEEEYFTKMSNEDSDVALLRVFECYLESAPQQLLQVILLVLDHIKGTSVHSTNQLVVLSLSLLFMGVCMANYNRRIRFDQKDKKKISCPGLVVQFLWHFNFTVSRILSISALAILNPLWTGVAVLCHWCCMTVWLAVTSKTMFCGRNIISEVFFSAAVGLIYIFNFITMKDGPTRKYYTVYYVLCIVENAIAATVWGVFSSPVISDWIYYMFVILPVLASVLSIVFLSIYYSFLHPNLQKDVSDGGIFHGSHSRNNSQEQSLTLTEEYDR